MMKRRGDWRQEERQKRRRRTEDWRHDERQQKRMRTREEEYSRGQEERQHKRRRTREEYSRGQEERQHKRRRRRTEYWRHEESKKLWKQLQHQRQPLRSSQISHLLPEHLLFEHVLPRLPVKSLLRFKSVSKSWNAEISHPRFVHLQLQRATTNNEKEPDRFLAVSQERNRDGVLQAHFHTVTVRGCGGNIRLHPLFQPKAQSPCESLPFCCNGLVLMSTYVVVNPSTREELNLPKDSKHNLYDFPGQSCIGYVSSTNEYKVVHLFDRSSGGDDSNDDDGDNIGVGIFTLGRDHSWRSTLVDPPYPISTGHISVHIDGWVYWLIDNNSAPNSILGLDLSNEEEFVVIPSPPCRPDLPEPYTVWITELDSQLCFFEFRWIDTESSIEDGKDVPIAVDIWTTKTHHGEGSSGYQWNKYYSSDNLFGVEGYAITPLAVHGDKLLVNSGEAIQYLDTRANKLEGKLVQLRRIVDKVAHCYIPYHVIPHVESLVSPNAAPSALLP